MTLSAKATLQAHLKRSWQGRLGKILISLVCLLSLTMFLSWLLLPIFVKRVAVEQVQQQLGRKLEIGDLRFSPFALALTADSVTLYELDQHTAAVSLKTLVLNLSLSSAWHRALVIDEVMLNTPQIHLIRTSADGYGRYNFSDILDQLAKQPKSEQPFRFSLANLQLQDGSILFDDKVLNKKINIDHLLIAVPFVSNFPKEVNSFVQPMLSANINGAPFELKGRSKPFVDSLDTTLAIDIDHLQLPAYLAYIPVKLPLTIDSADLSTKLDLTFSRKKNQSELLLSGEIQLKKIALKDGTGAPLFSTDAITAHLKQVNLFTGASSIDQLKVDSPQVWVDINKSGQLNWATLFSSPIDTTKSTKVSNTADGSATKLSAAEPGKKSISTTPVISLNSMLINKGQVHFSDAVHMSPVNVVNLKDLNLNIKQLSTDVSAKPASILLTVATDDNAVSQFEGQFSPSGTMVDGNLSLTDLSLGSYQTFINPVLAASLAGKLALQSHLHLQDGQLQIGDFNLQLADFSLQAKAKGEGGIAIRSLAISKLDLDTATQLVNTGKIAIDGIKADVQRDQTAQFNLQKFFIDHKASTSNVSASPSANPDQPHTNNKAWQASVQSLVINDSNVRFDDRSLYPKVNLNIDVQSLAATNLTSDLSQAATFSLKGMVNHKGKLIVSADAGVGLKHISATLDAQALPVAAFYPYFARDVNIILNRGDASAKGKLIVVNEKGQTPRMSYDGNLRLSNFHMLEGGTSDDFLEWKTIDLDGISAKIGGNKPSILLKKLSLTDFYARAVLSDKGQLNLQSLTVRRAPDGSPTTSSDQRTTEGNDINSPAVDSVAITGTTKAISEPSAAKLPATPVSAPAANPVLVRIAQTVLRGGNVNFTDNFVRPNYSANLTGVSGTIGAIGSDSIQPATIELTGKIDNDAPLVISGALNPLASPLFLDIKGSANGIELTRLTPYAAKYAGYAIEKGKLSVQVSYKVENQQLQAENAVRLDQLTFGEKVDSPTATHLPVQLALALLRDNDGKISINLPISGSLSDPEFSVGGIIWRVFVNLITKAVTSPFALLGEAFGGGEELSYAEFLPGQATLTPDAIAKLDNLAKALNNRSGLRLDILGRVDPDTDTDGLRRIGLNKKIAQLKYVSLQKKDPQIRLEQINVDEADKKKYIEDVYKSEKFTKPRNVIGIAKTLPTDDAERLILANTAVTIDNLRALAQRRADTVRDYLEQTGGIAKDRLFLIAPKLSPDGIKDKGSPSRVDFSVK